MLRRSRMWPLGVIALLAGCSSAEKKQTHTSSPRSVLVTHVRSVVLGDGLSVSGRLVSREEAAVASQLSGYQVARVLVDQGDYVVKGQPLAILDDTLLRADIAQQKANVDQAQVAAQRAVQEADRVNKLDDSGVLSNEAISERRLAARSAKAQLAQTQAQLAAQLVRERLMIVRAPVSGRILTRSVRPGDVASPSNVMFTMGANQIVEVDAEIPEQQLDLVKLGSQAKVTLASGQTMTGIVRFVSAQVDTDTRLGRARVTLPVSPNLRPGAFAKADFSTINRPVLAVPEAAITYGAEGATVMTVDGKNKVHEEAVKLGRHGRGMIELVHGPLAGATVMTGSQDFVLPGDTVAVVADPKQGN